MKKSLETGIIPKGLKIKKVSVFQPFSEDFFNEVGGNTEV